MKLGPKAAWLAAYAALFAVCAAFVFWGTWSTGVSPVMPDCPISHPEGWWANVSAFLREWVRTGLFSPDDLKAFAGAPYFLQELQYAVPAFLAGLALAYYCRGRGLSRLASYSAGIFLSLSGYWFTLFSAGHLGWFRWMTYGVFAFGLADRAVRRGRLRHWLLLGAVVGWASFRQQDLWLIFTLFTGAYFVWCCVRERALPWKGALFAALAFALVGAPGVAASLREVAGREKQMESAGVNVGKKDGDAAAAEKSEAERKAEREKQWIFVTNWSLPLDEAAELFSARGKGDTSCPYVLSIGTRVGSGVKPYTGALGRPYGAKEGNYRQHSLYVGWVTCLLALVGAVAAFRRREGDALFFFAAAVLAVALSLGRYFEPLYRCVFALPVGDLVRCPVKWLHLAELSLAVLAAYGIDFVASLAAKKGEAARKAALCALGAMAVVGAFDLARVDRLYCAPVDLTEARRTDSSMQLSFLRTQDFSSPQVAEMMRLKRIVSLARLPWNPDVYLVEVLTPRQKDAPSAPWDVNSSAVALGIVSLLGTLAVAAVSLSRLGKKELT